MNTSMATTASAPSPVHISEVEASEHRGGQVRMLLSPRTVGATSGLSGHVTLAPHEFITEHYHPYSEEHVYVVEGDLSMRVAGVEVPLMRGEALCIPTGVRHRLQNVGPIKAEIVFHLSPLAPEPRLGHVDTEHLPGSSPASEEQDI